MYAYARSLHEYTYSKYAYAYNWDSHACPIHVHAYSCQETLICFCLHVLVSVLLGFHISKSLSFCFVLLCFCFVGAPKQLKIVLMITFDWVVQSRPMTYCCDR